MGILGALVYSCPNLEPTDLKVILKGMNNMTDYLECGQFEQNKLVDESQHILISH